jgi:hypothetical protein
MERKRRDKIGTLTERERYEIAMQRFLATFVCALLGISCLVGLALFCFQGFHTAGFNLERPLMHWVGVHCVGCIGSLSALVYKAFFAATHVPAVIKIASHSPHP